MSNVNADATQLLTILKNMRTSISSIETTRSSVKMKYQQLGIGWNDKKYDELGTIVKDCNKALNDILQIMLQAEKYVASLAPFGKSIPCKKLCYINPIEQHPYFFSFGVSSYYGQTNAQVPILQAMPTLSLYSSALPTYSSFLSLENASILSALRCS